MAAAPTVGNWDRLGDHTKATGSPTAPDPTDHVEQARVREFLQLARDRFQMAQVAEGPRRAEMLIDLRFRCGLQWDEAIKMQREKAGRPCLTINRIPGFLKHVTNAMRQARPEIKIDPVGDGADEEIAEIRQGLVRHILNNSHFEVPADTSFEQMSTMGLGWMRVVDAWAGFNKELFVEWIPNTFSVYSDPAARRPDWSDAKWRFIVEDYDLKEFRAKFGAKREACGLENFKSIGDQGPSWMLNGKIRVAEYFHIEEEEDILCELPDGSTQLYSEMDPNLLESVVQTRPETVSRVVWTLMDGVEILKERKWKGKYIPVIPVIGNQVELDGERILVGMVRYARESQRMFNYMYSCFVEAVALAPKAPFIAEFDQISEFKDIWERANVDAVAVLPYRMKTSDGMQAPPPQRQQAEPPVLAFVQGLKLADQNLKSTFSIFDAALGERGPQESGTAINSRKIESDLATYDWIDNFIRALTFLGIVLNDLLEHYYNEKGRIVQITREDLTVKAITINKTHLVDGKDAVYDLSKGKFSVHVSTGPAHSTKREEAARSMIELAKVYPPLWQAAGPRLVRAMDWPQKDAIAAQLEKMQPPELREKDPNQPGPTVEEQQQKLDQMQQMVQQLSEMLTEATDANEQARMKEEFATFRTQMQQETALAIAQIKTGSAEATYMNDRIFTELERIRLELEPKVLKGSKPKESAAPASAPPEPVVAPAQPQAPPQLGEIPGGDSSTAQML